MDGDASRSGELRRRDDHRDRAIDRGCDRGDVCRRAALGGVGTALAAGLAGCSGLAGGPDPDTDPDVIAGPRGRLAYDPAELTVSTGETVVWQFASEGHNVSCVPGHGGAIRLPDDAEPFASYPRDGAPHETDPVRSTYEHAFEVPGEYVYVCTPHERAGMVGTIVVEG